MPSSDDKFPLRIGNALVCEDVRQELGGKHSLLGVYSGDIIVQEFKDFLKIAVYIELFPIETGQIELEATFSYDGNDILKAKVEYDFKDIRNPGLITSPSFPIPLTKAGAITVNAICRGQSQVLLRKDVRSVGASVIFASSTSPSPPAAQLPNADQQSRKPPAPRRPLRRPRGGKP